MKIILGYKSIKDEGLTLKTMVWPDSSMVLSRKPVFMRDDESSHLVLGFGVRITGVGKSIRKKFARKYYSEIAPLVLIGDSSLADKIKQNIDPLACDIVSDFSIISGDSMSADDFGGSEGMLNVSVKLSPIYPSNTFEGYSEEINIDSKNVLSEIDDAIEKGSERNTLKTGDIVGYLTSRIFPSVVDSVLRISVNSKLLVENKLK